MALGDNRTLIEQAQKVRADDGRLPLRVLAVVNLADPGENPDTVEAAKALEDFPHCHQPKRQSVDVRRSPMPWRTVSRLPR